MEKVTNQRSLCKDIVLIARKMEDQRYHECIGYLVNLILNKQTTQSQIAVNLRDALVAHSGTQKRRILYNKIYGGFGYSREFCGFLRDRRSSEEKDEVKKSYFIEDREKDVEHVRAFGKELIEKHPGVSKIFVWYAEHGEEQNEIFGNAKNYLWHKKQSDRFESMITKVDEKLQSRIIGTNNEAPDVWTLLRYRWKFNPHESMNDLSARALETLRDKARTEKQKLDEVMTKESPSIDILKILEIVKAAKSNAEDKEQIKAELHEENEAEDKSAENSEEFPCEFPSSFLEALSAHGAEAVETWISQDTLSPDAVMFYLTNKNNIASGSENITADETAFEAVGLLAASGSFCELAIAEVPIHAKYKIGEYDGQERVYLI